MAANITKKLKSRVLGVTFAVWAAVVLTGGSSLMASHLAALPTPAPIDPRVVVEVARGGNGPQSESKSKAATNQWSVVHVLAESCGCSRNIVEHLGRRDPIANVRERILWVSAEGHAPPPAALQRGGFAVDIVSPTQLAERLGVIGAPTLIVASPDGVVKYVGGYSRQKQSPVVLDKDVITRLQRGEQVETLPVLGCAIDKKTARRMDPLGLR